jgi:hypothetical protein
VELCNTATKHPRSQHSDSPPSRTRVLGHLSHTREGLFSETRFPAFVLQLLHLPVACLPPCVLRCAMASRFPSPAAVRCSGDTTSGSSIRVEWKSTGAAQLRPKEASLPPPRLASPEENGPTGRAEGRTGGTEREKEKTEDSTGQTATNGPPFPPLHCGRTTKAKKKRRDFLVNSISLHRHNFKCAGRPRLACDALLFENIGLTKLYN